jgi:eukaryotic-like serine/threonine-protein kinase
MNEYWCRNQNCAKVSIDLSLSLEKIICSACKRKLWVRDESKNIYFIKEYIGCGGYGDVYKACKVKELKETQYYAIKFLRDRSYSEEYKTLNREIKNLTTAKNAGARVPQSIGIHGSGETDKNQFVDGYFCIQEYIDGSNLKEIKEKVTDGNKCSFNEEEVFNYLIDLLSTICLIQSQQIIHRDIKPSNIIKEKESQKLYLIDFGSSKDLTTDTQQTTRPAITPAYSPPELWPQNRQSDSDGNKLTIDLYSLAITMFDLLTGENKNSQRKEHSCESWDNWMVKVKGKSHDLYPILEKMSRFQQSERYTNAMEALMEASVKAFGLYEDKQDGYLFEGWLLKMALNEFKETKIRSYQNFLKKSEAKEKERNMKMIRKMIDKSEEE